MSEPSDPAEDSTGRPTDGRADPTGSADERGDRFVDEAEVQAMYGELRRIARRERQRVPSATLNTTALVHEAWMKLLPADTPYESRRHFLGTAAVAMRHLVVDYARSRSAQKRGGDVVHVELGDPEEAQAVPVERILDIDRALHRLQAIDPALMQLVELRFFAGLTSDEAADVLGISPRTATRDWARARAMLKLELSGA